MSAEPRLASLQTPALVLDQSIMLNNISRLEKHAAGLGVQLRPHLKTAKSVDVVKQMLQPGQPATVSTLREAEVFADCGVRDMLYAVGISPRKLDRVTSLLAADINLSVVLDSPVQADSVISACRRTGLAIPVFLEIDSDGHRSGLAPEDPQITALGRKLHDNGATLQGVMTHAGKSYTVTGHAAHAAFAEQERRAAVTAATRLKNAGLPCPIVSVGSSPTAHAAEHLEGVTELRAGVYVFFDLVMAGIGVCKLEDIAISVLTTVIGHQRDKNWALTDAGWMALSQDRSTTNQVQDQHYGLVCDEAGQPIPDLLVLQANQEHGIIGCRPGSQCMLPDLPVGTRLRILPIHACATAAQHDGYHVLPASSDLAAQHRELLFWPRFGGW